MIKIIGLWKENNQVLQELWILIMFNNGVFSTYVVLGVKITFYERFFQKMPTEYV